LNLNAGFELRDCSRVFDSIHARYFASIGTLLSIRFSENSGLPARVSASACDVRRFSRLSTTPTSLGEEAGGADRDRTGDLRLAKPALSQLSYSPRLGRGAGVFRRRRRHRVGQGRLELPTSRLSGVRSNHLSYWPNGGIARRKICFARPTLAYATVLPGPPGNLLEEG
jgi:hypothetical protein